MSAENGHRVALLHRDGRRVQHLFGRVLLRPERKMLRSRAADDVKQGDGVRPEASTSLDYEGMSSASWRLAMAAYFLRFLPSISLAVAVEFSGCDRP